MELQEIKDKDGNSIKNVVAIVQFRDGIVVATKDGIYTNVKELLAK